MMKNLYLNINPLNVPALLKKWEEGTQNRSNYMQNGQPNRRIN